MDFTRPLWVGRYGLCFTRHIALKIGLYIAIKGILSKTPANMLGYPSMTYLYILNLTSTLNIGCLLTITIHLTLYLTVLSRMVCLNDF